jgi:RND superfamily putative drug exporter
LTRLTRTVVRFRWIVLGVWLVVLLAGGYSSSRLSALLSNTFTVPGTDSERARTILQHNFGDRSDGEFLVVFKVPSSSDTALKARLESALTGAAKVVPGATATPLAPAGGHILYGSVLSQLTIAKAKGYTAPLLTKLRETPGATVYVTGQAAIQHDLDPIFSKDLKKGESIALPIALLVLLAVFGLSFAVAIPFIFAACTIMGTLGLVYIAAQHLSMATYVTNLVQLIGLGIAIDYSLLIVYRFREELARGGSKDDAILRTMETAGRAVVFSGAAVALGLAVLLFMPLPFMRSMGVGGFLIPIVSIIAAVTLQPALLSLFGRRGTARWPAAAFLRDRLHVPLPHLPGTVDVDKGFWSRLAREIMASPGWFFALGTMILVVLAVPAIWLALTPGSAEGIPRSPQSVQGFDLLKKAVGAGALSPTQIVIDAGPGGNVIAPTTQQALINMRTLLDVDKEVAAVQYEPNLGTRYNDKTGRYAVVVVSGKHEYGTPQAQAFVHRLRGEIIPGAGFPDGVTVIAGGGPPQGVDFLSKAYGVFPWVVLVVLVLTYLLLLRAFRSWVLPLKAVLLNLLSVAAAYGVLVLTFRWGAGRDLLGLYQIQQVEGWIPIFLFAMLFGLSMDYEVFLVSRMRESWDHVPDNGRAVAHGLERTGRIVTAAAIIMVAAFSGFMVGSIVGLQEFGLGLAVAILLDVTLVRMVLVPSLMALLGRYNWWLPAGVARVFRVKPSPLHPPVEQLAD